ncbi:MAG: hypothetical protein WA885_12145 [Phormidesmis sp.]
MSFETTIEQRLATLERIVSDLQEKLSSETAPENWLENLVGSISDESAFLEALEYGRAFRQADRPEDEASE